VNRPRHPTRELARGSLAAFLLLACCGGANEPPVIGGVELPAPARAPCGLNANTQFGAGEKLVAALKKLTPQETETASDLENHCNAVWQEAVDGYYCGEIAVPAFCNTCTTEPEKSRCFDGNGHGLVMQRCYEASSKPFAANFEKCKDFAWCDSKLQLATGCKASH
jgi:hypothetical protein